MRYFQPDNRQRPAYTLRQQLEIVVMLCTIFVSGCQSHYRHLRPDNADVHCIEAFRPQFTTTLYSAYVDVTKHHFSGILFFKQMPDSSIRIVFTNEIGVKFFDFAFTKDDQFIKYYALRKLDKKIVINALKSDLHLALVRPDFTQARALKDTALNYVSVPDKSGFDYYITDNCKRLVRIEKASKRKPVVEVQMLDYRNGVPDSIHVQHKNFKFTIALKRVER